MIVTVLAASAVTPHISAHGCHAVPVEDAVALFFAGAMLSPAAATATGSAWSCPARISPRPVSLRRGMTPLENLSTARTPRQNLLQAVQA